MDNPYIVFFGRDYLVIPTLSEFLAKTVNYCHPESSEGSKTIR
jgi:hypothetical protein